MAATPSGFWEILWSGYGEASGMTSAILSPTRFGDYVHVRLAQPDTRFFSAFGYAVTKDTSTTPRPKLRITST